MLPKINRLRKRKDFESVFKKGKKFSEDFLVLRKKKNDLGFCRFGFIVGMKISKKAILRNKIKRRLRSLVKKNLSKVKNGIDIILIARPGLEAKTFQEIEVTLDKLFRKAKIVK